VVGDSNVNIPSDGDLDNLDPGERAVYCCSYRNKLVVLDDLLGRQVAVSSAESYWAACVLDEAAKQKLLISQGVARLQQTTFRASSKLIQSLLQQHQSENKL